MHAARNAAAPMATAAALLGLALAPSCFAPVYQSGHLQCAAGDICPDGFFCGSDMRCWRMNEGPEGGPDADPDAGDSPPIGMPVVIEAAAATPAPVQGTSTVLTVRADDPQGESALTYTWTATGPGKVAFSDNSNNDAKNTTVIFTKSGHYAFTALIQNRAGGSVTSTVELDVHPRLNDIEVMPSMAAVPVGTTVQFTTTAFDQFGDPVALTVPLRWQLAGNCGTVNDSGLFQAGTMMASGCTLIATTGTIISSATVSVGTAQPLVINAAADTYVDDGEPDKNFGGVTVMYVKTQTGTTNNRIAYLKFPLTGATLPVSSAKLRLFGRATGGTHTNGVYVVPDTAWNETMVTWKNKPARGPRLIAIGVTTAPKYHEWDITAHLQARLAAGDATLSLAVVMDVPITTDPDAFDSREATNKPQLVLTP
jgi:hypothetical protein